jgi:Skp family chaperone for outer membrane proteins
MLKNAVKASSPYLFVLIVMAIAIIFSSSFSAEGKGNVAVVDLDLIAAELGRNAAIEAEVSAFITDQNIKLNAFRDQLRGNIEQQTKKLASDSALTEDSEHALASLVQRSDTELNQSIAQAEKSAQLLRQKLVLIFKDEVKPVARSIAKEQGMQIVMIKANGMLDIAPEAEISKMVVDKMLAMPSKLPKDIPSKKDATIESATE